MTRLPFCLALAALVACGGSDPTPLAGTPTQEANPSAVPTTPPGPVTDPVTPPTPEPTPAPVYAYSVDGTVTNDAGPMAAFAGPGTVAGVTSVQLVDLAGNIVSTSVVIDGAYTLGYDPTTEALLVVEGLNTLGEVLGSAVVEVQSANQLAVPITVESSVEAAVLALLQADGVSLGAWSEARARIDTALAVTIASEADVAAALEDTALAVATAWEAHNEAWIAAGASATAMNDAWFAASIDYSNAIASGSATATADFRAALEAAAIAQGVSATAWAESEAVAYAAVRSALLASQAATAVTFEATQAAALAESITVQANIAAQANVAGLPADVVASIELAFTDLEAALQGATTIAEVEAAVEAWRASLLTTVQGQAGAPTGIPAIDQFLQQFIAQFQALLTQVELIISNLETSLQVIIDSASAGTGTIDPATLAADVVAAYEAEAANIETNIDALVALNDDLATLMTSVSLAFAGM